MKNNMDCQFKNCPNVVVKGSLWCQHCIDVVPAILRRNQEEAPISPAHYLQGRIEPWDFIVSQDLNFLAGNVVKYISRYKHKNGVEDLKKAKKYLEKLIVIEEQSK